MGNSDNCTNNDDTSRMYPGILKKKKCSPLSTVCYLLLFLVISCRSVPQAPEIVLPETGLLPLDPGASVYIIADAINARPILDQLNIKVMKNKQLQKMIDKTHYAMAAVYLNDSSSDNELRYQLRAWGRYPTFRAKMALGTNRNWKKQRATPSRLKYWYSAKDRISVALDSEQAFAAAANRESPVDPFPSSTGTTIPDGFGEFGMGAILSCWLEKPDQFVNKKLSEMGIPIELPAEQIFISLFPEAMSYESGGEQHYTANIRMQLPSVTQARALTTIFAMVRSFFSAEASPGGVGILAAILFSNPPVQDGRNLNIKTNELSAREISLLFNLFSL